MTKRTNSHENLKDRTYEIAINPKFNGYKREIPSMVYKLLTRFGAITISKAGANINEELAQELGKPVIKKFKGRKMCTRFKDNIWAANLAEMGSYSSKNGGVEYLLCVIDVFTKCAWVKTLDDEKTRTVLHGFIERVNK